MLGALRDFAGDRCAASCRHRDAAALQCVCGARIRCEFHSTGGPRGGEEKQNDGKFEYMLGLAWARTHRRLTLIGIPEIDREGYALAEDLRDAVWFALRSSGFRTPALDELLTRIEHKFTEPPSRASGRRGIRTVCIL